MKRLISTILCAVMLFGCLALSASAEDVYLKLHVLASDGSGVPASPDAPTIDTDGLYYAYVDNEDDFNKVLAWYRDRSIKNKSEDVVVLNIRYADVLTLEKFYALYGYDKLIEEYKEKYGEDIPEEDLLSYKSMYRAKIFPYHKAVAERDFEVSFGCISYELSYGFGYPGANVKVAGDKITFADVETLLKDERISYVGISSVGGSGYISFPTDSYEGSFSDVKISDWYFDYVELANTSGLMEGTSATTFEPNATLTRSMLVTMIGRFEERLNGTLGEAGENHFSDVKLGKWYSDYVAWAAENGVVEGYPDGTFRPDAPVTREEAVTLLGRYYKKNAPTMVYTNDIVLPYFPHTDTDEISDWAYEWVLDGMYIGAVHYEEANGDSTPEDAPEYYFEPKRSMTRAEAAKVAYIFLSDLEMSIECGYCTLPGGLTAIK